MKYLLIKYNECKLGSFMVSATKTLFEKIISELIADRTVEKNDEQIELSRFCMAETIKEP